MSNELTEFLVIQEPKSKNRHCFHFLVGVFTATSGAAAIKMAGGNIITGCDYKKPRAVLLRKNTIYWI
jgi:hypothetical protein